MAQYKGTLEIDRERGVIYFHLSSHKEIDKYGMSTMLRICKLKTPIPEGAFIDITGPDAVTYEKQTNDQIVHSSIGIPVVKIKQDEGNS